MIKKLLNRKAEIAKSLFLGVATMLSSSAFAVESKPLVLDSTYVAPMFVDVTYQLVADKTGLLQIRNNDGAVVVSNNLNEDGSAYGIENLAVSTFSNYKDEKGNVLTTVYEVYVKKGETLYVTQMNHFSNVPFRAHIETEGMDKVQILSSNRTENEVFDITDERMGQLEISCNMPILLGDSAYLSVPGYPSEEMAKAGYGRLWTRTDPNNNRDIYWMLKDTLDLWMKEGIIKGGEVVTLKFDSLRSLRYGDEVFYGENGAGEFHFLAPSNATIHRLIDKSLPDTFKSYYVKGDTEGLITLTFDDALMSIADGQTANLSLKMGNAEMGDAYAEDYSAQTEGQDVFRVEGNKLIIDLTGKLRTLETMGLQTNWGSFTLRVQNVKMADGTNAYTESKGSSGSYTFTMGYTQFFSNIAVQYIPDAEETLDDNEIIAYFSQKSDIDFSAIKITYQDKTTDEAKETVVEKNDIEAVEAGENGIRYIIPITDEIKSAKNVRLSYIGVVAKDGLNHPELDVRFNPGPELLKTFAPKKVNPTDGSYVTSLSSMTLTFDEAVTVNTPAEGEAVVVKDETAGQMVSATVSAEGTALNITFDEALVNTHKYTVTIAEGAIGNKEYAETNGKYGNTMPAQSYSFYIYKSNAGFDFIPTPFDGSTLSEISRVEIHSNRSKTPLSYTNNEEKKAWIEDAEGNKLQEAKISSAGEEGVAFVFEPAFKGNGQYYVVIGDSIYFYGEGFYCEDPNPSQRKIPYTLVSPVEKTFAVDALPADNAKVATLSQIFLTADEPVYLTETTVTAYNQMSRKSVDGKLTKDPDTEYGAVITFDSEITAAGTWNVTIPEGVLGDKTWSESNATAGKCNDIIDLYYDVTGPVAEGPTADPENGSTVASLSSISIDFGQTISNNMEKDVKAYVRDENGLRVAVLSSDNNVELDWDNFNLATVTFPEAITEEGTYTISFPDGFFVTESGDDYPAFDLTYTVEGGDAPEPGEEKYTVTPADSSAVKSLKDITLVFDTNNLALGSGMITVKDATTGTQIARLDAEIQWPENYSDPVNTAIISLPNEITDANAKVITVEIPAGYFETDNGTTPAITLIYYVGDNATAINGVAADAQNTAVYNLNGVCVSTSASGVKALPKGVYIINGKKVFNK